MNPFRNRYAICKISVIIQRLQKTNDIRHLSVILIGCTTNQI